MPRVSQVSMPSLGQNYGWLFDIQSINELENWLQEVRTSIARADLAMAVRYVQGSGHANLIAQLAELKGISIVDACVKINNDIWNGMHKILAEQGRVFVNSYGGYFGMTPSIMIEKTQHVEKWVLPQEKVRVIQWDGGTHFYAKIGNLDVVWAGQQKWSTRAEAETAAKNFIKKRGA